MYKLSRAAAADIEKIAENSLIEFGLAQTGKYLTSLHGCLELLAKNPEMGREIDEIRPGYRKFPHQSHLIFYRRENAGGILIVRVLHHLMDAERHLNQVGDGGDR
ncbi:type II toxin-antitoxin system RelE/ParE family toxin [Desulfurivibrio sp. D14AmB]|uniref:type II toxin-antitoxin system RelE/ParE family toxin n=1 Tax=Desulfurivibrio sp. D14AmB TaxID=3374370 RepID=UPI00376EDDD0